MKTPYSCIKLYQFKYFYSDLDHNDVFQLFNDFRHAVNNKVQHKENPGCFIYYVILRNLCNFFLIAGNFIKVS